MRGRIITFQNARGGTRIGFYRENDIKALQLLNDYSRTEGNVIITDFRNVADIPKGNRFLVSIIFPVCNVSEKALFRTVKFPLDKTVFFRYCLLI